VRLSATLRVAGTTVPAAPPVAVRFGFATYLASVSPGRYVLHLENDASGALVGDFPTGALAAGSVITALVSDPAPGSQAPATLGHFTDAP
jgi:hypothetical protein